VSAPSVETTLPRLLTGVSYRGMGVLERHLEVHGRLPGPGELDGPAVVDLAERSGLRGRGGARFPAAIKMRAVRASRGHAIVVANGCESEPMSRKDALLLGELPHLVLDGAALAARAVGAERVIVAFERGASATRASLEHALAQRQAAASTRCASSCSRRPRPSSPARRPRSSRRSTAAGQRRPSSRRARRQRGVRRHPTLVQNVETLAHLALIARHGAEWYAGLGTEAEPGSTLVTVLGAVNSPGVYEIECGTRSTVCSPPPAASAARSAGCWSAATSAHGCRPPLAAGLELSNAGLARHDAALGCGVVVALPASACPVAETVRVAIYLATETANQCGPCVNGSAAIARTLYAISAKAGRRRARSPTWGAGPRAFRAAAPATCRMASRTSSRRRCEPSRTSFDDHARHGPCDACAGAPLLHIPPPRGPDADPREPDQLPRARPVRGTVPRVDPPRRVGLPDPAQRADPARARGARPSRRRRLPDAGAAARTRLSRRSGAAAGAHPPLRSPTDRPRYVTISGGPLYSVVLAGRRFRQDDGSKPGAAGFRRPRPQEASVVSSALHHR
jgi:NADH:ubiquinone oxidoreductase subunit F (NADH-binding)